MRSYRHGGIESTELTPASEQATLCSYPRRHHFSSVNAKQLARPALQAGPSRCESGHGCHFVRVAQLDQSATVRRWRPQVQLLPWTPFALVPQQPQERFRKPLFVGASPTRGSKFIRVVM